jgi:hypothetical protein
MLAAGIAYETKKYEGGMVDAKLRAAYLRAALYRVSQHKFTH